MDPLNVKAQPLQPEDMLRMIKASAPKPMSPSVLFFTFLAAFLVASVIENAVAHVYAQHQLGQLQKQMEAEEHRYTVALQKEAQRFEQRLTEQTQLAEKRSQERAWRESCQMWRNAYSRSSTQEYYRGMIEACSKVGMPN